MDPYKPIHPFHFGVSSLLAPLLFCVCATTPVSAEPLSGSALASQEAQRRASQFEEARLLIQKGDQSYESGSYSQALQAYSEARNLLGNAPHTQEWKAAATERFCQSSTAQARKLARQGNLAAAKETIQAALAPDVDPNHPLALACLAELNDPIRTNPASSPEHTQDIVKVRDLLYTAEGAYNLGRYDLAADTYQKVLQVDPTNAAARRGLEKTANARSQYAAAAYDHTRSTMLGETDAQWALDVPPDTPNPTLTAADGGSTAPSSASSIEEKLNSILIPKIALDQVNLTESVEFLRARSRELDTTELDPARKGVNFTINLGGPESQTAKNILSKRFSLQLTQIPLSAALKYICDQSHTTFSSDGFSVVFRPANSDNLELISRTYRVPPDFLSNISAGTTPAQQNQDPFAETTPKAGLLTARLTAQQALATQGVSFPEGATATLRPGSNTLAVTNTASNHDIIQQIIDLQTQSAPSAVAVEVTMVRTETTTLNELGFDWLINPAKLGSDSLFAGGGTAGNASGRHGYDFTNPGTAGYVSSLTPANSTQQITQNIVTSGLRSGSQAINQNAIDNIVNNFTRTSQEAQVAPGILSVMGVFSDTSAVQMMLRGLSQGKNTDVMAKPSVVSKSGTTSSIQMARTFIYPAEYEPPELPNSVGTDNGSFPVTPAHPTDFTTRDVGISLEVMPQVDATKQYVDLTLSPALVDFDGFVNYGTPITSYQDNSSLLSLLPTASSGGTVEITKNEILMPIFSTQRTNTQVTIANGATIVIAGLLQDQVQNVEDKVPVFGDLPLVGRLFTSNSRQRTAKVVLFLVHVRVTDPSGASYSAATR